MTVPARPPSSVSGGSDLAQRYAAPAPWRRRVLVAVVAVVAAVFIGWVAWVAWIAGTPLAQSDLIGFEVESDNSAVAHVAVQLDEGVVASCRVRAFAEDHTTVGEVSFTPEQGRNDVEIRTDRRAITVELIGCTTPDQRRPR